MDESELEIRSQDEVCDLSSWYGIYSICQYLQIKEQNFLVVIYRERKYKWGI